ncbi:MAG TPA: hypothetical protein VHE35_20280 [Kofleriaceae bacterium]|nr:hypothetical protein [Kofleriaceae bacterium]
MRDDLLATDCAFSEVTGRCLPVSMGATYAEAACTHPIGGISQAFENEPPGVAESPAFIAVWSIPRFYRRGAATSPVSLFHRWSDDDCSGTAAHAGMRSFEAGDEVPVDGLAPLQRAPRDSGTRIRPHASSTTDGPLVDDGELYDSALGTSCFAGQALDGSLRCIPNSNLDLANLHSDCCQTPVRALAGGTGAPAPFAIEAVQIPGACPSDAVPGVPPWC